MSERLTQRIVHIPTVLGLVVLQAEVPKFILQFISVVHHIVFVKALLSLLNPFLGHRRPLSRFPLDFGRDVDGIEQLLFLIVRLSWQG